MYEPCVTDLLQLVPTIDYKMITSCSRLVNDWKQAVRTRLVEPVRSIDNRLVIRSITLSYRLLSGYVKMEKLFSTRDEETGTNEEYVSYRVKIPRVQNIFLFAEPAENTNFISN